MWNNKTIEWIDVELTSFCNIACPGCLRQEKKEQVEPILNKDIIDFDNLKRWITFKEFPNLKLWQTIQISVKIPLSRCT